MSTMYPDATTIATTSLPLIDLANFTNSSTESRLRTAKQLVSACHTTGFVYIINHGVPKHELECAFAISSKFFALPPEEKMKAPHPPGWSVHRGYSSPGFEKVSNATSSEEDEVAVRKLREVQDVKESYEVGSELNPDMPNIWPPEEVLPEWRPFMTKFYWTCFEAAKTVLKALALGIGLEEDALVSLHSGHYNQLRLLNYPPIPAQALEEGISERMPAHTDWSTMTMLWQDDCGGLQVEDPNHAGKFIDVEPVEGALVMNIGDLMMRWSNDVLRSTSHRVTLPPLQDRIEGEGRIARQRKSIVYFLSTDPDRLIEVMGSCVDENRPAKYKPITQRDYAAMRARMQY